MKIGDLVKINNTWIGYRYVDEEVVLGVIRYFEQDRELDENLEYKWKAHLTMTSGIECWVFVDHLEVISENR